MQRIIGFIGKAVLTVMVFSIVGCATRTPRLLVGERSQLSIVDLEGYSQSFLEGSGCIQVTEDELFVMRGREVIVCDKCGNERRRLAVPKEVAYAIEFVVVPDGRLAFLDNRNDAIYFCSAKGEHLETVKFKNEDDHLQNMHGIVVDGRLVVSENGDRQLLAVDLATYQVLMFRDFSDQGGWLGAITYADGKYYLSSGANIYVFSDDSNNMRRIARTPTANITGMSYVAGRLFVVVNGQSRVREKSLAGKWRTNEGSLYEVNPETGQVMLVKDGLNYPGGMEVIWH